MSVEQFDTVSAFSATVIALLGQAEESIRIFDVDLRIGPLSGPQAAEAIGSTLHRHPKAALTLVLHDTGYFATACPRLVQLYHRRTHQIRVLESAPRHREVMQPFMVVDRQHLITRFHADFPRGKLCLGEAAEVAPYLLRFDELVEAATPASGLAALNL